MRRHKDTETKNWALMFVAKIPLIWRVILISMLGVLAWLIAFSRIVLAVDIQTADGVMLIMAGLFNGVCFLLNTGYQLQGLIRHRMKWNVSNTDLVCWFCLLSAYGSTMWIQYRLQPDIADSMLLSFLIVIHSIHAIRFTPVVAISLMAGGSMMYALLIPHPTNLFIGAYIATQQIVLWAMGMGVLSELLEGQKLKSLTAELTLTQARLEESTRLEERRKIRQDLHDKMGHELAAMNAHLQILGRKLPDDQPEHLQAVSDSCQRLFSTLSEVVGELKQQTSGHFYDHLLEMIDKVPGVDIRVDSTPDLRIKDAVIASQLLCCIQESLTNILKHSNARRADIRIRNDGDDLTIRIRDFGDSVALLRPGNGLRGMQERMARIGGSAAAEALDGGGVAVTLRIHRRELI